MSLLYLTPLKSSIFSPLSIPGCQLWLDAADATTITLNSGNVSQWNDKSGLGNNCSQSSAAYQPAFITNAHNGLSSVRYDGSIPQQVLLGNISTVTMTATIFAVASLGNSGSGVAGLYQISQSNLVNISGLQMFLFSGGSSIFIRRAGASSFVDVFYAYIDATYGQFTNITSPGLVNAYQNGTLVGSSTTSIDDFTSQYYFLGNLGNPSTYCLNGDISELLVYAGNLTSPEQILIQNYLKAKWGTP